MFAIIQIENRAERSNQNKRHGHHKIDTPVQTNGEPDVAHSRNGFFAHRASKN